MMRSLQLVGLISLIIPSTSFAKLIPKSLEAGRYHSCMLSEEGVVKCWGDNYYGQLGHENTEEAGSATGQMGSMLAVTNLGTDVKVVDICSGLASTCALTTEGKVKCWGLNSGSVLGQGHSKYTIGNERGSMGDKLPYTNIGDFKISSLYCGAYHACVLSAAGEAKCWGQNSDGQLGIESSKNNIGSTPTDMGDALAPVKESQKIRMMSLGYTHTCAVLEDESIKCWGVNTYGQLGIENTTPHGKATGSMDQGLPKVMLEPADVKYKVQQISSGLNFNCALYKVDDTQKLKCWGQNYLGILGVGKSDSGIGGTLNSMGQNLPTVNLAMGTIEEIRTYNTHSCARNNRGAVKCWGNNSTGTLGIESQISKGTSPSDMGINLPYLDLGLPIKKLSRGSFGNHTCAILINGVFKCWGEGTYGKLGYESSSNIGGVLGDMGEQLPFVLFE